MSVIQEKAREIFEELKKQSPHSSHEEIEIKATTGWFAKFRRRSGIKPEPGMVMHSESASADEEAEKFCLKFQELINKERYCLQQIYIIMMKLVYFGSTC